MVNQGKYNGDFDNWGLNHNYYHETLNNVYEHIDIQSDTSLSSTRSFPVIKAGSLFMFYSSATANITSQSAGNNVFPPSTTISYPNHQAIFEYADINSTNRFSTGLGALDGGASTSLTYYYCCSGANDISSTSIGLGNYNIRASITPTFSYIKGGWYSTDLERVLCKFSFDAVPGYPKIERIYRKDVRWNVNSQSSTYTAVATDDIIITNSTIVELPDNFNSEYMGVKISYKNLTTEAKILGNMNGTTSLILGSSEATEFVGGSTTWYTVSRYSTSAAATLSIPSFKTDWVLNLDWTNNRLGTTSASTTATLAHNLAADFSDLVFKLFLSSDGTEAIAIDPYTAQTAASDRGISIHASDTNTAIVQTNANGIGYIDLAGTFQTLSASTFYYKLAVYNLGG